MKFYLKMTIKNYPKNTIFSLLSQNLKTFLLLLFIGQEKIFEIQT